MHCINVTSRTVPVPFLLRGKRRTRRGTPVHRQSGDFLPAGQCGRREIIGDPPGEHYPFATQCTGASRTGNLSGHRTLSIGTEHIDDLIADLDQALAKI